MHFLLFYDFCVRPVLAGKLGNYYTGAYKLYHLRVGANDTDKNALDLVLRSPPVAYTAYTV